MHFFHDTDKKFLVNIPQVIEHLFHTSLCPSLPLVGPPGTSCGVVVGVVLVLVWNGASGGTRGGPEHLIHFNKIIEIKR